MLKIPILQHTGVGWGAQQLVPNAMPGGLKQHKIILPKCLQHDLLLRKATVYII